jgi:type IX secretion system PorP/SprF family membrane protein
MKSAKSIVTGLASICIAFTGVVNAQDIHFSQFTQSPLTVNPALAGTTVWIRAGLIVRDQWRAVHSENSGNTFTTMGAAFDIKSKRRWIKASNQTERYRQSGDNGFGWGVNIYNDRAGDGHMGTLNANATLAYQIMTGAKSMIALGFQGGFMQRSIQFDKLYWGTQYDPTSSTGYSNSCPTCHPDNAIAATGDNSFILPDLSTGMTYTYKKNERYMRGNDQKDLTLGVAMFHAVPFKYSFLGSTEKLSQRIVVHGQSTIGIKNTSIALVPAFLIQKQGPNQEIFAGTMVRYMLKEDSKYTGYVKGASISAGGYYRSKDAFVAAALFEFSSYGIGVSYDINVSGLRTVSSSRGGLEITLRFLNPAPFLFSQASFGK